VRNFLLNFIKDESGATAIEYALIAGCLSVVLVAVMTTLGNDLEKVFDEIHTALVH